MAYHSITYDLNGNKDYTKLINELTRLKAQKITMSQWLVELPNSQFELRDHLLSFIDQDDSLVVITFTAKPAYRKPLAGGKKWVDDRFES